jgi:hypothetical protein
MTDLEIDGIEPTAESLQVIRFFPAIADAGLTLADIVDEIEHFFECPFSELVCKLEIVDDYGDKPVPTFVVSRK